LVHPTCGCARWSVLAVLRPRPLVFLAAAAGFVSLAILLYVLQQNFCFDSHGSQGELQRSSPWLLVCACLYIVRAAALLVLCHFSPVRFPAAILVLPSRDFSFPCPSKRCRKVSLLFSSGLFSAVSLGPICQHARQTAIAVSSWVSSGGARSRGLTFVSVHPVVSSSPRPHFGSSADWLVRGQ
jgi:hypothetical protein